MKLKKNIAISETGFLFDPNTGESFSLNKTGQLILKLALENKEEKEIIQEIVNKYAIDAQVLQRYLDDFILMLKQYGIIENEEYEHEKTYTAKHSSYRAK